MDFPKYRHGLFPAVPVPHDINGQLDANAQADYVAWMNSQPIQGVAVWAHTGRGLKLDDSTRVDVLKAWRAGLSSDKTLIAAAGPTTSDLRPDAIIASAAHMAKLAAQHGADALLAHPPTRFRGVRENDSLILEYHAAIAEAGLPIILFWLYEAAGGVSYSQHVLAQLLARPEVIGIKIATLDSVMTYQQVARLVKEIAPLKILFTGEDRFLGYSLMCGANAALIGMGAAATTLQANFLRAFWTGDSTRFLELNAAIDDLAQHTFLSPMEGYIARMMHCLAHQGVLPPSATFDPWGPKLGKHEFSQIGDCLNRIGVIPGGSSS
jgi:4-hydroxy-tetrahydrodipicolinate synthase